MSAWENRETPPAKEFMGPLARVLGVTESWLLVGDEGLGEGLNQRLAEAEARGYERAREELRDRILRAIGEEGAAEAERSGATDGRVQVTAAEAVEQAKLARELQKRKRAGARSNTTTRRKDA